MKGRRHIILLLLYLFTVHVGIHAQPNANYVKTVRMLDSLQSHGITSYQFYNGRGWPFLSATDGLGMSGNYAYTLQSYDAAGNVSRQWLPVTGTSSIQLPTTSNVSSMSSSQYGDNCGYSCFGYDALGRQTESTMPGVEWYAGNRKKTVSYITNTSADNTSYSYGLLTGETATDEDGHSLTTFYNLEGQKVLENRGAGHNTRYIYNDLGQLTSVLMPGHNPADPNHTSYGYEYDAMGRVVKKRYPGAEYIQYWYDHADRVAFMQDGMLRQKGRYRFMLYDAFGRLAVQGTCSGAGVAAVSSVVPTATFTQNSGGLLSTDYVVSNGVSMTDPTLEIVNYYDSYAFLSGSMSAMFSPVAAQSGTCMKGLTTGSVTAVSNGGFIYSLNLYDDKGRMVETRNTMPDASLTERLTTTYSFTGNPLSEEYLLSRTGQGAAFIAHTDNTYYPANDRLHTASLQVGLNSSQPTSSRTIQTITYDNLGQVSSIARPGSAGTVSYGYDLHGWITAINSPSFKEELYYASDGGCSGTPCYNGNISVQKWSNNNYAQKRGYKFAYDALNRLTEGIYGERDGLNNHQNYFNEQILEYYKSGAVKRLQRRGRKNDGYSGKIDNLHITVKGNRLHYVSDDADKLQYDGAFDFNGDASNSSAFQYNANGSLITDTGKGIMFIEYDDNGMPRRIQFADGNVTEYVYTATGRKLRTVYYTAIPGITVGSGETHQLTASEILSKDSIDYLGSLVMENGVPAQYLFAGGYCLLNDVNASGGIGWHYYNRDHLGNNREVVSESGVLEQVTNYYPFGAPFCERTTAGVNTNATLQRYKYNGKELDLMHGLKWYDYGARMYDPILLTWNGIDPLCEDYYPICPYAYCGNNPVNAFDPDGLKPKPKEAALIADDVYKRKSGILPGGWRRIVTKSGIILNNQNSGFKSAVYGRWDAKQKNYTEYVYATAGTDGLNAEDWRNNIDQLTGESAQYEQSIINARQLDRFFSNSELTFVGHSLGGGLASANSLATGRDAITFNAAGLSNATKTNNNLINASGQIDAYVVIGEALSNMQGIIGLKAEGNIHSISVPLYIDNTIKTTSNKIDDIVLSLWKHTMGCVIYILK